MIVIYNTHGSWLLTEDTSLYINIYSSVYICIGVHTRIIYEYRFVRLCILMLLSFVVRINYTARTMR